MAKNGCIEKPSVNNLSPPGLKMEFEEFKKSELILTSLAFNLSNTNFFSRFKKDSFNFLLS